MLEDMSPDAFRNLVHWFYRDYLDPNTYHDRDTLVETWIAADRLLMTVCKNRVMDKLREVCQIVGVNAKIIKVAEPLGYSAESSLLMYLTDQLAFDCVELDHEDLTDGDVSQWTPQTHLLVTTKITALARRWRRSQTSNQPAPTDPLGSELCYYHDHIESEDCYAK
ncbi:hypothetical protein ES702_07069 [subsurface metagenome]